MEYLMYVFYTHKMYYCCIIIIYNN